MDRRFLSQPEVVKASRAFVCVRLATYENAKEAKFTQKLCRTFSGKLENTTLAVLTPDGNTAIIKGARGPKRLFYNAEQMAQSLNKIAERYSKQPLPGGPKAKLPIVANVRLGLNMASSDNLPLVLVYSDDAQEREMLARRVNNLAWETPFVGRFLYASTSQANELNAIKGMKVKAGILILQSDRFGQYGTVLSQVSAEDNAQTLAKALRTGIVKHTKFEKSKFEHVRSGAKEGIFWKTVVPVTDPLEAAARLRTKYQIERFQKK